MSGVSVRFTAAGKGRFLGPLRLLFAAGSVGRPAPGRSFDPTTPPDPRRWRRYERPIAGCLGADAGNLIAASRRALTERHSARSKRGRPYDSPTSVTHLDRRATSLISGSARGLPLAPTRPPGTKANPGAQSGPGVHPPCATRTVASSPAQPMLAASRVGAALPAFSQTRFSATLSTASSGRKW